MDNDKGQYKKLSKRKIKRIIAFYLCIISIIPQQAFSIIASAHTSYIEESTISDSNINTGVEDNYNTDIQETMDTDKIISAYSIQESEEIIVTFDTKEGTINQITKQVKHGNVYGTLPTPEKKGYTFDGWYLSETDGNKVNESSKVQSEVSHTLHARWVAVTCTVYLYSNGGRISQEAIDVTYGEKYTNLPTPVWENYTFDGWYTSPIGGERITSDSIVDITSSFALYARWIGKSVHVNFNANGGTTSNDSKEVYFGGTYGILPIATREGYHFAGWYLLEGITTEIDEYASVITNKDHTLYASWEEIGYRVSFDANGGTVSDETKTVLFGEAYGSLPTPTYKGHTFVGWYTLPYSGTKITSDSIYSINLKQMLYAHWVPNEYTVKLYSDGVELTYDSIVVTYGETYSLLPTLMLENYTFDGWYTSASGGTKITNETKVKITSEEALYAHWVGNIQKILFDANGGSLSTYEKEVNYGSTYGSLPKPTKTGYVFDGWYTSINGTTQVTANDTVRLLNSQTLYARWSKKTPKITFDTNGGTVLYNGQRVDEYTIEFLFGDIYGDLPIPTRAGYTFDGWYTLSKSGDEITSTTQIMVTTSKTIYAHWIGNSYKVSFNPGEGVVSTDSQYVIFGDTYGELPIPTRENYDFLGWYTEPDSGKKITSSSTVSIVGEQTLYARWRGISCKITFDALGGYTPDSSKIVYYKESYGELPIALETGLDFLGWYTDIDGGTQIMESDIAEITYDITLYARWDKTDYIITFDAGEGSVYPETKLLHYDDIYGVLPTPSRPGYTFDGWYTSESFNVLVTEDKIVKTTTNKTLYANWVGHTYIITLDATGGTNTTTSKSVTVGKSYGTLGTPTRSGYTFSGWYTKVSGGTKVSSASDVILPSAHTLYAHWKSEVYSVTFNANGGSVSPLSYTVIFDETYGYLPTPSKENYEFTGWYTAETGGSKKTSTSTVTITEDHTLYARWSGIDSKLYYDANGGNDVTSTKTITYGENYGTLTTPSRTGYTFDGWYTSSTGGTLITSGSLVNTTTNQTLYARWIVRTPTIHFRGNGGLILDNGEYVSEITVEKTYGTLYGKLPKATRLGYTFIGWFTSTSGSNQITENTVVEVTTLDYLYARWEQNYYTVNFDANGGNLETTSLILCYGDEYGTLPTPYMTGYDFDGWYTERIGGTKISSGTTVEILDSQTLYAHWELTTYKVIYDGNGGTILVEGDSVTTSSKKVGFLSTYGFQYGELPTAKRSGYHFEGWYTELEGGNQITHKSEFMLNTEQRVYAHWVPENISVQLHVNGGDTIENQKTVEYGNVYGELPTPTRLNYNFVGWFTSKSGGNEVIEDTVMTKTSMHTLYANWTPNQINISFDANGGLVDTNNMYFTYEGEYGELPTPTRADYSFIGWYTKASGGTKISKTSIVNLSLDTTIYAHWKQESFMLYYDSAGGMQTWDGTQAYYMQAYGNMPLATRTGYVFEGWYDSPNGGNLITVFSTVLINNMHTLYARWREKTPTILFNSNGGNVSHSSKVVVFGELYGTMPVPTLENYTFNGWYTSKFGGSAIDEYSIVETEDTLILYAHWIPDSYTVTFDATEGTVDKTTKTVSYESEYGTLPVPVKEGFDFVGWFTKAEGGDIVNVTSIVTTSGNHTLYARWIGKEVLIYYNANGGIVSEGYKAVYYNDIYGSLLIPTRQGYDFTGWFTEIAAGEKINENDIVTLEKSTTIYAHWKLKTPIVTFEANGGIMEITEKTVTYGENYGTLPTPVMEGFTFCGWYAVLDGDIEITEETIVEVEDAHSLYAYWVKDEDIIFSDKDIDNDGLLTWEEVMIGCNYEVADTDGDGLIDGDEIKIYKTYPLEYDSDYDGLSDGQEIALGLNPLEEDTDGDGLEDGDEIALGLNPLLQDTDGDGILDGEEVMIQSKTQIINQEEKQEIDKVTLTLEGTGNINNNTYIHNVYKEDVMASNVVGLIGVPIEISTKSTFTTGTLSFSYDEALLGNVKEENLAVLWFDEENYFYDIVENGSWIDYENNIISCTIIEMGTYMVVDKEQWFLAWSYDIEEDYKNYSDTGEDNESFDIAFLLASSELEIADYDNLTEPIVEFIDDMNYNDRAMIATPGAISYNINDTNTHAATGGAIYVSTFTNEHDILKE